MKKEIFNIVDALRAPIVIYPSPWKDVIPQHILENIPKARLLSLMKDEQFATIPECVAYLMPATFQFPFNYEWGEIYLYVSTLYMRDYRKIEIDKDIKVEFLDEYKIGKLNGLRRFIYDRRRKEINISRKDLKAKMKAKVNLEQQFTLFEESFEALK